MSYEALKPEAPSRSFYFYRRRTVLEGTNQKPDFFFWNKLDSNNSLEALLSTNKIESIRIFSFVLYICA